MPEHSRLQGYVFMHGPSWYMKSLGTFSGTAWRGVTRLRCRLALLAVKAHQVFLIPSHSSEQVLSNTSAARDNYHANSPGFSSKILISRRLEPTGTNHQVNCLALTGHQVPIHIVVSHHHCRMLSAVIQFCSLKYLQNLNINIIFMYTVIVIPL